MIKKIVCPYHEVNEEQRLAIKVVVRDTDGEFI